LPPLNPALAPKMILTRIECFLKFFNSKRGNKCVLNLVFSIVLNEKSSLLLVSVCSAE